MYSILSTFYILQVPRDLPRRSIEPYTTEACFQPIPDLLISAYIKISAYI